MVADDVDITPDVTLSNAALAYDHALSSALVWPSYGCLFDSSLPLSRDPRMKYDFNAVYCTSYLTDSVCVCEHLCEIPAQFFLAVMIVTFGSAPGPSIS